MSLMVTPAWINTTLTHDAGGGNGFGHFLIQNIKWFALAGSNNGTGFRGVHSETGLRSCLFRTTGHRADNGLKR
jgi:hypothetical protein